MTGNGLSNVKKLFPLIFPPEVEHKTQDFIYKITCKSLRTSVSVATTRYRLVRGVGVGNQMNNLEQVSSDHHQHQISLAGGVRPRSDVKGGDRSLGLMLGHLM